MSEEIKNYATERGIKYLMHFTRAKNLDSILRRGLIPRNTLNNEGYKGFNDHLRLDNTHAVCLSIDFPNYKMFHKVKQESVGETWVIVAIQPKALWELDCAFCTENAASARVTAIPLEQRKSLAAMQAMYKDQPSKPRDLLGIPKHYPTNPQAEVLMLQGVPREYILGVFALNEAVKQQVLENRPLLQVRVDDQLFWPRRDYKHWNSSL